MMETKVTYTQKDIEALIKKDVLTGTGLFARTAKVKYITIKQQEGQMGESITTAEVVLEVGRGERNTSTV